MLTLRPYQQQALDALYDHLRRHDDNPCIVLPTGAGKTPLLAHVCADAVGWQGRVLILAHVKELLQQAVEKLGLTCPDLRVGVHCAGLGQRDTTQAVIAASIQSVHQKACDLGRFDLVIVDEAHLIPPDGEGRYQTFLRDARIINPQLRVIGLTATPFRMKTGPLCAPDAILNRVCFEVGVKELIRDGFLCPLISRAGTAAPDTSQLHAQGGEFVAREAEALMEQAGLVEAACAEIVASTRDRQSVLIFATGVDHARHVAEVIREMHGHECGLVLGGTPAMERDQLLQRFKARGLKYLVNVGVLTTGFDATGIDCVVLLRPTLSPGLYSQMTGRGFRLHPGKSNCLILDYGGNVLRHGPVDEVRMGQGVAANPGMAPAKQCSHCHALIATGYARCPQCGFRFPEPERRAHDAQCSNAAVLSRAVTTTTYGVLDVFYRVHRKRDAADDAPRTLRVDYRVSETEYKTEWVCFEHTGWPRLKAEEWWRRRSPDPVPESAQRAADLANCGALALPLKITVQQMAGEKFETITDHELGPLPDPVPSALEDSMSGCLDGLPSSDDSVPF